MLGDTFDVTIEESRRFAQLSGDWNPLHVDPVYARRLMFGSTVVHGIDILLRSLQELVRPTAGCTLTRLGVSFSSPLPTGATARIEGIERDPNDAAAFQYGVTLDGRSVLRAAVATQAGRPDGPTPAISDPGAPLDPEKHDFAGLANAAGDVPLAFDLALASSLYPELSRAVPPVQLAVLLATTRIVGMKCPGLHSVYSELELAFEPAASGDAPHLRYRVTRADPRFKFLVIAVEGGGARGEIKALVRPAPVEQTSYAAVRTRVAPDAFSGRTPLVVGGSRGLGEVTAKILAAGGADVAVSYAAGAEDARRISEEIRRGGGRCHPLAWDVTAPPTDRPPAFPSEWKPDAVYYFASPRIVLRPGASWDARQFERYCAYYVTGVARTVAAIDAVFGTAKEPLTLFYPSSVFVTDPTPGAAEYATAKAAGEAVCRQLALSRPRLTVQTPRLPRVLTDQTAGMRPAQAQSPLDVMLELLIDGSN